MSPTAGAWIFMAALVGGALYGGHRLRQHLGIAEWSPGTCCGCGRPIGANKTICNDCEEGREW